MEKDDNQLLTAALRYAGLGYAVFPCVPGGKTPLTARGYQDATTDVAQIEAWWQQHPHANIGLATGGMVVLDIDDTSCPWLTTSADREFSLLSGAIAETPRGGRHYVFRLPPGKAYRCSAGRLAEHVDVRSEGGYVVVAPSVNGNGRGYRWVESHELERGPACLPEPPAWLIEELDQLDTAPAVQAPGGDGEAIPEGRRNATLARFAGVMRRSGMSVDEIAGSLGVINQRRCQPPLPDREVSAIARSIGRYEPNAVTQAIIFDHYSEVVAPPAASSTVTADPGPIPSELLRVPGFIGEVMDYCLESAPYPNQAMAFCGALVLQAFLAARKVCDPGDNRTNIYVLGLAHSASGKDWPRKVNVRILTEIGLADCLGDRFASGEGIQDAMLVTPAMLFQTDEIDGMVQSINKSREGRHENIMGTLLTFYSAASSVFPCRRKAGQEQVSVINQPCLVLLGSAIPNHFYGALSERMLTNGFFARHLVIESGPRGRGREPRIIPLPRRIIEIARWWKDFLPSQGNLAGQNPTPVVIPQNEEAQRLLIEAREEAEREYTLAEQRQDAVGTTVWGRVSEHIRKLALIYALSENHLNPVIGGTAVRWATAIVMHQTRRMLHMARAHVAEGEFDAECLKLMEKLREAPRHELPHSVLLKRMKRDAKAFGELVDTLLQRGDIEVVTTTRPGTPHRVYRLRGET
jgi:Bifunctional DNA primase/polymerase, N-terminal/Primase C terminal 1 (PriCT-1)